MKQIKNYLRKFFNFIKSLFTEVKDVKKSVLSFSVFLLCSLLMLASGVFSDNTSLYRSANYFSEVIKTNNIKHIAVSCESNNGATMPNTSVELRSLYGAFGNRETNYAGTINSTKEKDIRITNYDIESNFSFVYIQSGTEVHAPTEKNKYYRHEFYPLDLMFEYHANNPLDFYSFMYISTTHARKIIDANYPGMFDPDTPLSELLENSSFIEKCREIIENKVPIVVSFEGNNKTFQVTNIFYEENYFYDTVHETIGEFLVGYNQYPEGFNKQATYFLNKYEFQNRFYLDYINKRYSDKEYSLSICDYGGLIKINQKEAMRFRANDYKALSIVLTIASILVLALPVFLMIRYSLFNKTFVLYSTISFFVPYLVCALLYLITKNICVFPPYYSVFVLTISILFATFFIVFSIFKTKSTKKVNVDE